MVASDVQTSRRNDRVDPASVLLFGDRLVLGYSTANRRLFHIGASACHLRYDAGRTRNVDLVDCQTAGEFLGCDEFRNFSNVLRLIRALPALARQRIESVALLYLPAQSLHPRNGAHPIRAL